MRSKNVSEGTKHNSAKEEAGEETAARISAERQTVKMSKRSFTLG